MDETTFAFYAIMISLVDLLVFPTYQSQSETNHISSIAFFIILICFSYLEMNTNPSMRIIFSPSCQLDPAESTLNIDSIALVIQ